MALKAVSQLQRQRCGTKGSAVAPETASELMRQRCCCGGGAAAERAALRPQGNAMAPKTALQLQGLPAPHVSKARSMSTACRLQVLTTAALPSSPQAGHSSCRLHAACKLPSLAALRQGCSPQQPSRKAQPMSSAGQAAVLNSSQQSCSLQQPSGEAAVPNSLCRLHAAGGLR